MLVGGLVGAAEDEVQVVPEELAEVEEAEEEVSLDNPVSVAVMVTAYEWTG